MSIDFSKVTAITTPSGSLSKINRTSDSVQLWPTETNDPGYMYINMLTDVAAATNSWTVASKDTTNIVKTNSKIGPYIKENKLYEKYPYAVLLLGCGDNLTATSVTDDNLMPFIKATGTTTDSSTSVEVSLFECINTNVIGGALGFYMLTTTDKDFSTANWSYGYRMGEISLTTPGATKNHCVKTETIDSVGIVLQLPTGSGSLNVTGWSQNILVYSGNYLPYIGSTNNSKNINIYTTMLLLTEDLYNNLWGSSTEYRAIRAQINNDMIYYSWRGTKPTSATWIEIE